eukprot:9977220-Lingulodinium_polyedra.AAC.1
MAKLDVAEAFRWLMHRLDDVGVFATELSAAEAALGEALVALYLAMVFGWSGAPGEWMAWAWALKKYHESWAPSRPSWNDAVAFHSFYLMDDQVLVEPDVGTRPSESVLVGREGTLKLLGPGAINLAKEAEEGAWETRKINWGVLYDTEAGTRALPEAKLQKAYFLVNLSEFDAGNEKVPRKLAQQLRGNQQYWTL